MYALVSTTGNCAPVALAGDALGTQFDGDAPMSPSPASPTGNCAPVALVGDAFGAHFDGGGR